MSAKAEMVSFISLKFLLASAAVALKAKARSSTGTSGITKEINCTEMVTLNIKCDNCVLVNIKQSYE